MLVAEEVRLLDPNRERMRLPQSWGVLSKGGHFPCHVPTINKGPHPKNETLLHADTKVLSSHSKASVGLFALRNITEGHGWKQARGKRAATSFLLLTSFLQEDGASVREAEH